MDVVGEGRNAASSGSGKKESGTTSEPGGSDKESDNDEKVCYIFSSKIFNILMLVFVYLPN